MGAVCSPLQLLPIAALSQRASLLTSLVFAAVLQLPLATTQICAHLTGSRPAIFFRQA